MFARDERLYVHMSRHDWEIPKTRDERIPEPRLGDNPQRFKLYPGTAMSLVSDQAVAIDWRDPVFATADAHARAAERRGRAPRDPDGEPGRGAGQRTIPG